MSEDTSEEKVFDATSQKLKKARERGQVSQSRDVLTAIGTVVAIVYVWAAVATMNGGFTDLFDAAYTGMDMSFEDALTQMGGVSSDLMIAVMAPMLIILCAIGILVSFTMTGGPVFSFHPLIPQFDRINPASGFKRLFGMQAFVTFGMNLLKVIALLIILVLVLRMSMGQLIHSAQGGMIMALGVFDSILTKLIGGLSAMMAVAAIGDIILQKQMFQREMRMTRTEMKTERKNMEGDPQIAAQRRQIARRASEKPSGVRLATFVVTDGNAVAIAFRYVEGETPVPVVVARSRGGGAQQLLERVPSQAVSFDDPIASLLLKIEPGDYVTPEHVPALAQKMRSNGAL